MNVRFLLPLLLALLASCAPLTPRELPQRPARASIVSYTIEGRVLVQRGDEARKASLFWQHGNERDELELSGPLGQKAARLSRDAGGARLDTASRETFTAPDWGSLAERVLGVALPLDNLAHWVTAAIEDEASKGMQHDPVGRPAQVWADGWRIDYLAYESAAPDALPELIELRRDDIKVRLKIDTWQLD